MTTVLPEVSRLKDAALAVEDLHVLLGRGVEVVRGVSLSVGAGEMVGLVGESGSGKTLTLRAVSGLMPMTVPSRLSGTVRVGDNDSIDLSRVVHSKDLRGRVGYIFQEPLSALNPGFSIGWQFQEALNHGHERLNRGQKLDRILEMLEQVGLPDPRSVMRSYPFELSGGMRQRVVIGLALLSRPRVLLADEPTTALDVTLGAEILDLITELQRSANLATILVSHDLALVGSRCARVAVMYGGRIVEEGPTAVVFRDPRHPYTKGLLAASVDVFGGRPSRIAAIRGEPGDAVTGEACDFAPRCHWAKDECWRITPALDVVSEKGSHSSACLRQAELQGHKSLLTDVSAVGQAGSGRAGISPSTSSLVTVDGLVVRYSSAATRPGASATRWFSAVDGISFRIGAGVIQGLVGESGSGKSTLGRAVAGLQGISEGTVSIDGQAVGDVASRGRKMHRLVQFIFQDPYSSLNPRMSISKIVERALILHSHLGRRERVVRVRELLDEVRLPAVMASRYARELSGGQRQRVAIARALAVEPKVIVADEPTSALDVSVQAQVLALLERLVRERALALLFITHDFAAIRAIADSVMVMHLGKVVESGTVDQIVHHPLNPYTRALLSAVPNRTGSPMTRVRLKGAPLSPLTPPDGCRLHPRCPYSRPDCSTNEQVLRPIRGEHFVMCQYATPAGGPWVSEESQDGS